MKRVLTSFGNPFGLALYDKAQHGVRGKVRNHNKSNGQVLSWILLTPEGEVISLHEDPVDYLPSAMPRKNAARTVLMEALVEPKLRPNRRTQVTR